MLRLCFPLCAFVFPALEKDKGKAETFCLSDEVASKHQRLGLAPVLILSCRFGLAGIWSKAGMQKLSVFSRFHVGELEITSNHEENGNALEAKLRSFALEFLIVLVFLKNEPRWLFASFLNFPVSQV